jgi:uncharacterized protein (TIGR00375 family)
MLQIFDHLRQLIISYKGTSMKFIADFHIHSHYSRATSKKLDLPHIYKAAQIKGINLVGTGDFTHPGWFSELSENLVPAEQGLYALKPEIACLIDKDIPKTCQKQVRFVLTAEISNIYKKNGRTRKNHNVLFLPNLDAVQSLNAKLDRIGNIHSDGRPILGLDAHHLLDMTLNAHEQGFLIPAHIWTPWFSLLGSKSGFDTLTECFEDLSDYLFAVETGLSSDPPMNRRVSFLDHLTLVSNSDAHSPEKLGREANLFNTSLSYHAIYMAMKTGEGFEGTIEFYPEEGKYHLDGHRKCNIRLSPEESQSLNGICPECGKPLTLGVLYRVNELADRSEKEIVSPHFDSLIPLKEILSEILQKGPNTKTVATHYQTAIEKLGSEFYILRDCPLDKIETVHIPLLSEAIRRLRAGHVHLQGGFDGEFGTVTVFQKSEIEKLKGQKSLFQMGDNKQITKKRKNNPIIKKQTFVLDKPEKTNLTGLNTSQRTVVDSKEHHLIIIAGPGTGKTRTITHRIGSLITEKNIPSQNILAVTFTHKATLEMKSRLTQLLKKKGSVPVIETFHSLCLHILEKDFFKNQSIRILNEHEQEICLTSVHNNYHTIKGIPSVKKCKKWIETAKQNCLTPDDDLTSISDDPNFKDIYHAYNETLKKYQAVDFEDILFQTIILFRNNPTIQKKWCIQFPYIFVDEYQDVNFSQYTLLKLLMASDTNLCVIGDPDQAIYGFRGSDVSYFQRFMTDFIDAKCIFLTQNYRSTETILSASEQIIASHSLQSNRKRLFSGIQGASQIHIIETDTAQAEGTIIVKTIEQSMGGLSHYSLDSGWVDATVQAEELGFSDFAVLYRTHDIGQSIAEAFERSGIPYHMASKKKQSLRIQSMMSILRLISGDCRVLDMDPILLLWDHTLDEKRRISICKWLEDNLNQPFSIDQLKNLSYDKLSTSHRKLCEKFVQFGIQLTEMLTNKSIAQSIHAILQLKGFTDISMNDQSYFDRMISLASQTGHDYSQFFSHVSLFQDIDVIPDHVEKVSLMSMHAAKGLEFPVVFIAGCEDNIIPFAISQTQKLIDEERRLFYVAVTRAKTMLYCTYTKTRMSFGKRKNQTASRFLKDIEQDLINQRGGHQAKKLNPKKFSQQMLI